MARVLFLEDHLPSPRDARKMSQTFHPNDDKTNTISLCETFEAQLANPENNELLTLDVTNGIQRIFNNLPSGIRPIQLNVQLVLQVEGDASPDKSGDFEVQVDTECQIYDVPPCGVRPLELTEIKNEVLYDTLRPGVRPVATGEARISLTCEYDEALYDVLPAGVRPVPRPVFHEENALYKDQTGASNSYDLDAPQENRTSHHYETIPEWREAEEPKPTRIICASSGNLSEQSLPEYFMLPVGYDEADQNDNIYEDVGDLQRTSRRKKSVHFNETVEIQDQQLVNVRKATKKFVRKVFRRFLRKD